jgi:hypothetical protein
MVVDCDQYGRVVSGWPAKLSPAKLSHSAPGTRRQWVAPTWERLETPMEVTMYAGRR